MVRPSWRAALVLLAGFSATSAEAQVTLGTGVRASTVDAIGRDGWRANQVVASELRLARPWLAIGSDGAVLRDGRGAWRAAGSLEAALFTAAPGGARLAFVGSLGEPARDSALYTSRLVAGARLSRRIGAWGAWLGADVARSGVSETARTADFTSGLWRQLSSAVVTLSLRSRAGGVPASYLRAHSPAQPDSVFDSLGVTVRRPRQASGQDTVSALVAQRWPEAEGRLFWAGARWTLDFALRGRLAAAGIGAAMWGSANAAWLLSPRVALVAAAGTTPGGLASQVPAQRHASVGLRLMRGAPLSRALPVELQPAAVGFEVEAVEPGVYRVALRVPRARIVEVTGDFTGWKPITLHRGSGDWWEATLAMTPGTHQINVRINGERWLAPPGATVVDDDFAGVVGVIVVR